MKSMYLQKRLITSSIPKKFSSLGYVRQDGSIKFQNNNDALNYAINVVKKPLQLSNDKQYEVAVALKDSLVLGKSIGTRNECCVTKIKNTDKYSDLTIVHGHPGEVDEDTFEYASPVSLDDVWLLNKSKYKTIYAINKHGEFNKMSVKKRIDWYLSELQEKFDLYIKSLYFPKEYMEEFTELYCKCKNMWSGSNITVEELKRFYELEEIGQQLKEELEPKLKAIINSQLTLSEVLHNFWKKHANDFGMEYTNDFSYLKK